jgi:hypothetical protein
MKKKIKLILSKVNLLLLINSLLFFFKKNKNDNSMNEFLNWVLLLFYQNKIKLIPFFGTLLGIYREGGVISHDNDIDFAILFDQDRKNIINFLIKNKFKKILACHIEETNQLTLEKYQYKNFEIDIFYIYEDEQFYYFYDNESNSGLSTIEEINNNIIVNPYINKISKFSIKSLFINNLRFLGPGNTKNVLSELYGQNFMKPDKYWRQNKRKNRTKTKFNLILNEY